MQKKYDESFTFVVESFLLVTESFILDFESFILIIECFILLFESFLLVFESFCLNSKCFILDIECFRVKIIIWKLFLKIRLLFNKKTTSRSRCDLIIKIVFYEKCYQLKINISNLDSELDSVFVWQNGFVIENWCEVFFDEQGNSAITQTEFPSE